MTGLLQLARGMDWVSTKLSRIAGWAVLAAALISAGNALVRYGLDLSSNAWLEIQWYLFGTTVMLGAPVVLKLNEHVRVDIIYGKLRGRGPVFLQGLAEIVKRVAYLTGHLQMSTHYEKPVQ